MERVFSWAEVIGLELNRFFRGRVTVQLKHPNDDRDQPDFLEFEVYRFGGNPIGLTLRRAHGFRFRNLWIKKGQCTERGSYPLWVVKEAMESFCTPVLNNVDLEFREEFIQIVMYLRALARVEAAANQGRLQHEDPYNPEAHASTVLGDALRGAGVTQADGTTEDVSVERRVRRPGGKKARKAAAREQAGPRAGTPEAEEMFRADEHLQEIAST